MPNANYEFNFKLSDGTTKAVPVSVPLLKPDDGGYYVPSVDNEGNLSFTPTESNMPSVPSANIKGESGEAGVGIESISIVGGGDGGNSGEWELIETITVEKEGLTSIVRDAFPDGTPYLLSAVKVKAQFFYPIAKGVGTSLDINNGATKLGGLVQYVNANTIDNPYHKATVIYQAKPNAGIYEFSVGYGTQGGSMAVSWPSNGSYQTTSTKTKIDNIKFAAWQETIPAGTTIEIWGVRA